MSLRIATLSLLLAATLIPALPVAAAPVDINSADAATLARELKGVGETKAAAIVEYRRTHGPFKTIDDLALVKGIGQKLVDRNRSDLRLSRVAAGVAPISGKSAPVASSAPAAASSRK